MRLILTTKFSLLIILLLPYTRGNESFNEQISDEALQTESDSLEEVSHKLENYEVSIKDKKGHAPLSNEEDNIHEDDDVSGSSYTINFETPKSEKYEDDELTIIKENIQLNNLDDLKEFHSSYENEMNESVTLKAVDYENAITYESNSSESTININNSSFLEILKKYLKDVSLPNLGPVIPMNVNHVNNSESELLNVTESNSTKSNSTSQTKHAVCLEYEDVGTIGDVEVVNATNLQKILQNNPNITSRSTPAECYLIYFFSPYCPFSAQGSAYVNALARSMKNIPVYGLDSIEYHSVNARYGVMGTPSLILFHNGNVAGRYNSSAFATAHLESFVHYFTNQKIQSINVTLHDFKSNLPSQVIPSTSYALYGAWIFLLSCGGWLFLSSQFYAKLTEAVLNNWREAEAQHAHDD